MKIHTNLTAADLRAALDASGIQNASLLMQEKRSRSHVRRFDVYFDAEPMKGRRQSQHYHDGVPVIGATYDEWGMFIEQVFQRDPAAKVGPYMNHDHFREATGHRFNRLAWADQHPRHSFEWVGDHTWECAGCSASKRRNTSGFTA